MDDDRRRSPVRRRGRVVALALTLLVFVAAGLAALQLDPRLRRWVIEEASKQGVRMNFSSYSLGFSEVSLEGVSFARDRPVPITGQAQRIAIRLDGFKPQAIELQRAEIDILSSVPDLLYELRGLSSGSKGAAQLPVTATSLLLLWKTSSQSSPSVALSNAALSLDTDQLQMSGDLKLMERALGKATLKSSLAAHTSSLDLAFLGRDAADLHADVSTAADPATLVATLKPTPLTSSLPGLALQSKPTISGSLDLRFPTGLSAQNSTGKLTVSLDGVVPPHPPQLDGFLFGNRTDISSDLVLSRDYRTITLMNLRLQAGAFALTGSGAIERHDTYALLHLQLNGRLSCASIAASAAQAKLDGVLGQLLGNAANQALQGEVDVAIKAQIDSRAPEAAQIDKTMGLGCGLRPATLKAPPFPLPGPATSPHQP